MKTVGTNDRGTPVAAPYRSKTRGRSVKIRSRSHGGIPPSITARTPEARRGSVTPKYAYVPSSPRLVADSAARAVLPSATTISPLRGSKVYVAGVPRS